MTDSKKVLNDLQELCEYLFNQYKYCCKGDEEETYNRFLAANNALELIEEQQKAIDGLNALLSLAHAAITHGKKGTDAQQCERRNT